MEDEPRPTEKEEVVARETLEGAQSREANLSLEKINRFRLRRICKQKSLGVTQRTLSFTIMV